MRNMRNRWLAGSVLILGAALGAAGCLKTPIDTSDFARGPAPLRMPSPAKEGDCACYEDSLTGGQVFTMYCSYCHNAPSLAERPYSQFRNVAAHMRVRANLTGKEYAKLEEFLRRWNDVPPPNPPVEPSPNRLIFSQPMNELREKKPEAEAAPNATPAKQAQGPDEGQEAPR
jgi:hypothetical protein